MVEKTFLNCRLLTVPTKVMFNFFRSLLGFAVLPFAHHSQGPLHCVQLQQRLLQSRSQCIWDGSILQCSVPVTRPAAPCPAADQWQWLRPAVLPAGQGPESQLCAGVQLHAQSLLLWSLSWLSGQPRNTFLSAGVGVQRKIFIHLVDIYFLILQNQSLLTVSFHSSHQLYAPFSKRLW